jgi:hypothetical protein
MFDAKPLNVVYSFLQDAMGAMQAAIGRITTKNSLFFGDVHYAKHLVPLAAMRASVEAANI